jgi:hypothetical protein
MLNCYASKNGGGWGEEIFACLLLSGFGTKKRRGLKKMKSDVSIILKA